MCSIDLQKFVPLHIMFLTIFLNIHFEELLSIPFSTHSALFQAALLFSATLCNQHPFSPQLFSTILLFAHSLLPTSFFLSPLSPFPPQISSNPYLLLLFSTFGHHIRPLPKSNRSLFTDV